MSKGRADSPAGLRKRGAALGGEPSAGASAPSAGSGGLSSDPVLAFQKVIHDARPHLEQAIHDANEAYKALSAKRFKELAVAYGVTKPGEGYPGFWSDPCGLRDFQRAELRSAAPRLLYAVFHLCLGVYVNSLSQAWLHRNIAGYYSQMCPKVYESGLSPLWDVAFRYLPKVPSTIYADVFAFVPVVVLVFRFFVFPGPLSLRWTILRRWAICWGSIFMIRGATIIVTPLPNPDFTCQPLVRYPDNLLIEAFLIAARQDLTCEDVMFSGHTVCMTCSMLFILRYSPLCPWTTHGASRAWLSVTSLIRIGGFWFMLFGFYAICGSHFHYTLDVLVGALVTFIFVDSFHNRIELAWLRKHYGGNSLLDPLVQWLEKDAKDLDMELGGRGSDRAQNLWLRRH